MRHTGRFASAEPEPDDSYQPYEPYEPDRPYEPYEPYEPGQQIVSIDAVNTRKRNRG